MRAAHRTHGRGDGLFHVIIVDHAPEPARGSLRGMREARRGRVRRQVREFIRGRVAHELVHELVVMDHFDGIPRTRNGRQELSHVDVQRLVEADEQPAFRPFRQKPQLVRGAGVLNELRQQTERLSRAGAA